MREDSEEEDKREEREEREDPGEIDEEGEEEKPEEGRGRILTLASATPPACLMASLTIVKIASFSSCLQINFVKKKDNKTKQIFLKKNK